MSDFNFIHKEVGAAAKTASAWSWARLEKYWGRISLVVVILGTLGFVVKPHAEEFIRMAVNKKIQVLEEASRVQSKAIQAQTVRIGEQTNRQTVTANRLKSVEGLQKESRDRLDKIYNLLLSTSRGN